MAIGFGGMGVGTGSAAPMGDMTKTSQPMMNAMPTAQSPEAPKASPFSTQVQSQTAQKPQQTKLLSKQEVSNFINQGKEKGVDARSVIGELRNRGYELEGYSEAVRQNAQLRRDSRKKTAFENIVGGVGESVSGVAEFVGTGLAKGIGAVAKTLGADAKKVDDLVASYEKQWETLGGETVGDEETTTYKIAKGAADLIQTVAATGAIKKVAKGTKIAKSSMGAVNRLGTEISKQLARTGMKPETIAKVGNLTQKVLQGAGEGALGAAVFKPISESELASAKELGMGAAVGGALPIVGEGVKRLSKEVYKLFMPVTQAEAKAKVYGGPLAQQRINVGDTALEKKLFGTKVGVAKKAVEAQNKIRQDQIAPKLDASTRMIPKKNILEPVKAYIDDLAVPGEKAKFMKAFDKVSAGLDDNITVSDAQRLKSSITEILPNKVMAGEGGAIEKQVYKRIADELRKNVIGALDDEFGGNVGREYIQRGNLQELINAGVKEAATKSETAIGKFLSPFGVLGNITEVFVEPVGTRIGVYGTQLGNLIQQPQILESIAALSTKSIEK